MTHIELMKRLWIIHNKNFDLFSVDLNEMILSEQEWLKHQNAELIKANEKAEAQFNEQQVIIAHLKQKISDLELLNPWS